MIDIHSHILPGLDDGAATPDDALAMVRMAAAAGTTDIVASPHANAEFRFDAATVERKIAELQLACGATPRIHYGCDFHLTLENIQDALISPGKYSLGHNGYLLVEFSDFLIPKTAADLFARMLRAGLRPVVTHPERNPLLRERIPEIRCWVEKGCAVQVTGQSLLGRFGSAAKAASQRLMSAGLVHFLASDGHDCRYRPPTLDRVRDYVRKEYGVDAADLLTLENPQAALAGEPIRDCPALSRRKWYLGFAAGA